MTIPIMQLMAGASGAISLLQKIFGRETSDGSFDSTLENILTKIKKPSESGGPLKAFLSKEGARDDNMLGIISALSASPHLFQIVSVLKGMGLDSTDIKAIFAGNPKGISDSALKSIISTLGFSEENIAAIMGDSGLKYKIKTQISSQLKDILKIDSGASGEGIDVLIKGLGLDSDKVMDKMISAFKEQGIPGQSLVNTNDILKDIIATALVKSGNNVVVGAQQGLSQAQAYLKATRIIDILKHTLGIKPKVIKEIFFGTNPELRTKAVEEVAKKIAAYLKAHQGGMTPPEVREALTFVGSVTSESEWASIQNIIKSLNPGFSIVQAQGNIDKAMFMALAGRLSGDPGLIFDKTLEHIMDQLRASIPRYVKNGQGKMSLRLYPPMLGRVDVNISLHDGELQAAFRTDQVFTRDILQQHLPILREALAQQGIRVNHFAVTLGLESKGSDPNSGFASSYNRSSSHDFGHQRQRSSPEHTQYAFYKGYVHADGLDVFA
ncbi:MAG: flagellar hook-length control protein FliK [Deltaproteobacteria bacterium]|nr:flagellar hook-length control protein FliK [Deltaproteobacteria bacterium]